MQDQITGKVYAEVSHISTDRICGAQIFHQKWF
jgi:hypothetical protein